MENLKGFVKINPVENEQKEFWMQLETRKNECVVKTFWGRIGRKPRERNFLFSRPQDAVKEMERITRVRLKHGYIAIPSNNLSQAG